MGRHLSPRYGQVILVSGYPVLTAVNWSQHWCAICVQYQSSCAPKLARKCGIEHWFPCGADGRAADGLASHADILRRASRVPSLRTSAELKGKFLSHCSQISAGDHTQIIGDPIGAVEVKVLTSQTHTYKLCRGWYVTKDFCSTRESRR